MAKRYRYAFAKKREAQQGKTVSSAGGCFTGFICDCSFAGIFLQGQYGYIVGGSVFAQCFCLYMDFAMGLKSFSEEKPTHKSRYDRLYCKRNHNDRMAGNLSDGNFRLINREV